MKMRITINKKVVPVKERRPRRKKKMEVTARTKTR